MEQMQSLIENINTSFMFIGSHETIPHRGNVGDVALINGEPYVFCGEEWQLIGDLNIEDSNMKYDEPPKKILPIFCETCGANLKGRSWCEYCGNKY